jgi:hypothetical protein
VQQSWPFCARPARIGPTAFAGASRRRRTATVVRCRRHRNGVRLRPPSRRCRCQFASNGSGCAAQIASEDAEAIDLLVARSAPGTFPGRRAHVRTGGGWHLAVAGTLATADRANASDPTTFVLMARTVTRPRRWVPPPGRISAAGYRAGCESTQDAWQRAPCCRGTRGEPGRSCRAQRRADSW